MSAQYFSTGKQIHWRGEAFEVKRLLPDQQVCLENIVTGTVVVTRISDLIGDLYEGSLVFVQESKHVKSRQGSSGPQAKYLDMDDYPETLKAIARFRLWVIQPLLGPEARTRQFVIDYVKQINDALAAGEQRPGARKVSVSSVYRWISDYKQSGCGLRALIPDSDERGGKGQSRLEPEVDVIINAVIEGKYLTREKASVEDIRHEVAARVDDENRLRTGESKLSYPARSTIDRRIDMLDVKDVFIARHGKRAAQRQFTQFSTGPQAVSPLDRVEIDHTPLDLIVVDDEDNLPLGHLTLTDCMDIATRYPLGYYLGFEPPSYYAVMECLYHAICPKEDVKKKYDTQHDWIAYGIPLTLATDNGKEFIGHSLEDTCLALNIVLEQMPIRTPHYKGKIERLFKTITTVVHGLPGTTFSNVRQRGDYDSVEQACVYTSEVEAMLNTFFVDIYAERLHKGLGEIPARRWHRALENGFLPRLPASAEELSILLGQVAWRTVQHYGVDFESIRYNSPELALLRNALKKGERVKIKFHPGNLSRVYVYNPFDKTYIEAKAQDDQGYTQGLSLWKHRVIRRFTLEQQDEVDLAALGRAKRNIQAIVDKARSRKRVGVRSRIARWDKSGQPPSLAETDSSTSAAQTTSSLPALPGPTTPQVMDIVLAQPSSDGDWDITYDLPKSTSTQAQAIQFVNKEATNDQ